MSKKKSPFYNTILNNFKDFSSLEATKKKCIERKLHASFKTIKRKNGPFFSSNQLKRNIYLRFFFTAARLRRNFLPDYLLKTSEKSQKERWQYGEKESALISKRFSLLLKRRLPDFHKQWNFPMKDETQAFIEFPTLWDVRKAVLYYPTAFFFLTKSIRISELKLEDFNLDTQFKPIKAKQKIVLLEAYTVSKLIFLLKDIDIIKVYYKNYLKVWTSASPTSLNFSILALKSAFFGTEIFFNTFKNDLRFALKYAEEEAKKKSTTINCIWFGYAHEYTRPFFLTLNPELDLANKLFKVGLNYSNLPLEIVAYLTADSYIAVGYKEDFFDILEQFFHLNYIRMRDMDNVQVFIKNKKKMLNDWVIQYGVSKEFILYCLEQYLRGKDPAVFQPLKDLLYIEQTREIKGPLISDTLVGFKYDLFDIIFSFFYRQSTLFDVLNFGNIDLNYESQKKNNALYTRGLPLNSSLDFFAILDSHVNLTNTLDSRPDDLYKLAQIGYPLEDRQPFWNFDTLMHIVEKQIQKAFFDALLEIFPSLRCEAPPGQTDPFYTLSYLSRENRYFFLPVDKVTKDLDNIFTLLHEKVTNKTCYRLTFSTIDLTKEKMLFETSISLIKKNILDTLHRILKKQKIQYENTNIDFSLFTKILLNDIPKIQLFEINASNNFEIFTTTFFEINFDFHSNKRYYLSYLEIQYVLEKMYPMANLDEILLMRLEITSILKNFGFSVARRRIRICTLPREFSNKLISSGQYKPDHSTILGYVFYGIRLHTSPFEGL
jgi:hypothetical protein